MKVDRKVIHGGRGEANSPGSDRARRSSHEAFRRCARFLQIRLRGDQIQDGTPLGTPPPGRSRRSLRETDAPDHGRDGAGPRESSLLGSQVQGRTCSGEARFHHHPRRGFQENVLAVGELYRGSILAFARVRY